MASTAHAWPPVIDISKQAEGADTRYVPRGASVSFTIVVKNAGDVKIKDSQVTDPQAPGCARWLGYLAIGASVSYTCTVDNVQSSFTNEACATGVASTGAARDCDPSTVKVIAIDIRKQAEGPDSRTFPAGSNVPFEIVVTNTGGATLHDVRVSDAQVPGCARSIGTLAAGASVSYTCTAANVQQTFTSEACASGSAGGVMVRDCDPSTVVVQPLVASIDIRKQAEGPDSRTFAQGSSVTFNVVVTNTGGSTLSDVSVTDPLVPDCARFIGSLAAGASTSYTCTAANVRQTFTSEACASGGARGVTVRDCDPSTVVVTVPPAAFLVIDEDSIDNGNPPNFFSPFNVNDDIAEIGVRTPLRFFQANVGRQIVLHTGQVGDEGWFAPETIPASWSAAGPTSSGLRNYLTAGPGLGRPNANGDREALLDKVPDVNPLRATGLRLLTGRTVCAVVYDSDISMNYGPLNGSLKGANLGIVAFTVDKVERLIGFSSGSLPKVTVTIRDAPDVCREVALFTAAPEPTSSSEPYDINP